MNRRYAQISRRALLRAGALSWAGLTLPELCAAENLGRAGGVHGSAKSCILFFLEGGPAHQDLWDMKPQAPTEVRGEFKPISSTITGVPVCEYLPLLARQLHHVALVRSVHHKIVDHNAGSYYALTGRSPSVGGRLIVKDDPESFPPFGSVMAKLHPSERLPEFVHIPEIMSNNGFDLPGERAGFLGPAFDPLVAGDPSAENYQIPGLTFPSDVSQERLQLRKGLLARLNRDQLPAARQVGADTLSTHYEKAFTLLSSVETRNAFALDQEPFHVRSRYGLPDRTDRSIGARQFGGLPHLGQSLLLARRLIEAGVRLVTVCTGRRYDQSWDTHRQHFPILKKSLLPYFDRGFSALLEDLSQSGLMEETLVVAMGEFGRTPRLGQITSGAGADAAGRDHWPHCYTVLMAGGGVQGGVVYGESDREAAYPKSHPVTPEDIAATIYHALGVDPAMNIYDALDRPHALALGTPIVDLFQEV